MHNTDPAAAVPVAEPVIRVEGLAKEYRVYDKPEGRPGALSSHQPRGAGGEGR
jgi:hypothetical protein